MEMFYLLKKFYLVMSYDFKKENFSKEDIVTFGVVVPIVMTAFAIAVMGIIGWVKAAML